MIHITKGLLPFWDEHITDTRFTTAALSVNKARKEGVVMTLDRPWETAAGTFVTGATNELSCDGPLCEPYTAYMQGGLTYEYGKLGVMRAVDEMLGLHEEE